VNPEYADFLASKAKRAPMRGTTEPCDLAPHLFDFQRSCVEFGLRAGSWGLFLDTGLGKTACELEWARHVARLTVGSVLILCPLAVARQIEREGKRWRYDCGVIRGDDAQMWPITISNYDQLDNIRPERFAGIVLDESSILKSFTGATTRKLIETFRSFQWRMCATATPAPNDHIELGNHSEFLGIMPNIEMLANWFVNDSANTGTWRLKGHARRDFWDWMASWSRMAAHPRDLGDAREGFDLPALGVVSHVIETDLRPDVGELFAAPIMSATSMHDVKRQTSVGRAAKVAEIIAADPQQWIVWCDTDYEADALKKALDAPDVVEVRGSHPVARKEDAVLGFLDGSVRVLISKSSIYGFGLNLQNCARMAFVGRSFSYESYYQAVRRCWRFGQTRPVEVHLIVAEGEDQIGRVIDRKAGDHSRMKTEMTTAMARAMGRGERARVAYAPTHEGRLPAWL
jgi:hypothetical protein